MAGADRPLGVEGWELSRDHWLAPVAEAIVFHLPTLDPARFEPSRIVTLLCAVWLIAFAIPLFLYTPDLVTTGERFGDAMRHGVGNVFRTISKLKNYRNVALFLVARMLYADGKTAILIFSGIYAAGTMGWGLIEMLAYGIILTIFAVPGGIMSGWLDHSIGPKRAVIIEIGITFVCLVAMVSMTSTSILFFIPVDPTATVSSSPLFNTLPELAYHWRQVINAERSRVRRSAGHGAGVDALPERQRNPTTIQPNPLACWK